MKFDDPLVVRSNSTVESVCDSIHRSIKDKFRYALVWGTSVKYSPQKCGLAHLVGDEDVVSIVTK